MLSLYRKSIQNFHSSRSLSLPTNREGRSGDVKAKIIMLNTVAQLPSRQPTVQFIISFSSQLTGFLQDHIKLLGRSASLYFDPSYFTALQCDGW